MCHGRTGEAGKQTPRWRSSHRKFFRLCSLFQTLWKDGEGTGHSKKSGHNSPMEALQGPFIVDPSLGEVGRGVILGCAALLSRGSSLTGSTAEGCQPSDLRKNPSVLKRTLSAIPCNVRGKCSTSYRCHYLRTLIQGQDYITVKSVLLLLCLPALYLNLLSHASTLVQGISDQIPFPNQTAGPPRAASIHLCALISQLPLAPSFPE